MAFHALSRGRVFGRKNPFHQHVRIGNLLRFTLQPGCLQIAFKRPLPSPFKSRSPDHHVIKMMDETAGRRLCLACLHVEDRRTCIERTSTVQNLLAPGIPGTGKSAIIGSAFWEVGSSSGCTALCRDLFGGKLLATTRRGIVEEIEFVVPGDPPIHVSGRRSARASAVRLSVSRFGERVTVTIPPGVGLDVARRFVDKKRAWILRAIGESASRVRPKFGDRFPLEGIDLELCRDDGSRPRGDGSRLFMACEEPELPARLGAYCRTLARRRLAASTRCHAGLLSLACPNFRIKDTVSRWGSCSTRGNLNFSWRLIMMPPEILDYVVAHEVSHMVEMNHSRRFWSVVARLCPDYAEHRSWLKEEGARYLRFELR